MGQTHYWYYNRPFTENEWKDIGKGFQKLIKALPSVLLANVAGNDSPIIADDYIAFNGTAPQAVEPFELFRTREAWAQHLGMTNGRKWRGYCKTESQPYDLAVMALLLMVTEVAPGALDVESDEKMDGDLWKKAREVLRHTK